MGHPAGRRYEYRVSGLPAGGIKVGATHPERDPDFANDVDTLALATVFTLQPGVTLRQSFGEPFGPYLDLGALRNAPERRPGRGSRNPGPPGPGRDRVDRMASASPRSGGPRHVRDPRRQEPSAQDALGVPGAVQVRRDAAEVERPAGAEHHGEVDLVGRGDDALVEHEPDLLRQPGQHGVQDAGLIERARAARVAERLLDRRVDGVLGAPAVGLRHHPPPLPGQPLEPGDSG